MSEQSWRPSFRQPRSTLTKVLTSPAFVHSRQRSGAIIGDPAALRELADAVEAVDRAQAPLSTIADRVAAAVRFLRATADRVESGASSTADSAAHSAAGSAARERLIVAALHYLVTPVDLVPDFRPGGYLDDVLLLSWVFGAAASELTPSLRP